MSITDLKERFHSILNRELDVRKALRGTPYGIVVKAEAKSRIVESIVKELT